MDKRRLWKWGVLAALILLSMALVILPIDRPLREKVPLGLDLRGGVSLVLAIDEENVRQKLRDAAPEGMSAEQLEADVVDALKDAQQRAVHVIRNRIDAQGLSEPQISAESATSRIIVQIPGASDEERRKVEKRLQEVAFLTFHLVHEDNAALVTEVTKTCEVPRGFKMVTVDGVNLYQRDFESGEAPDFKNPFPDSSPPSGHVFLFQRRYLPQYELKAYVPCCVNRRYEFSGEILKNAGVELSPLGEPYVKLEFTKRGAKVFARVTGDYAPFGDKNSSSDTGRQLAAVLDDTVFSAPVIRHAIYSGDAQIEGSFPGDEAYSLAQILRTGSLPAPVKIVRKRTVDPTLGADSIRSGIRSIVIGGALVIVFMLGYYMICGLVADIALILNLLMLPVGMVAVAGFLGMFTGATTGGNAFDLPVLTLPGIAGILLAVGMAVDANVLIFERMREEFRTGKRLLSAITAGYDRAAVTILDANLTTLLTGVILYFAGGAGPIRGFAVTLCAGILLSMFTALVVTRMLLEALSRRVRKPKLKMLQLLGDTTIDFVTKRKLAVAISVAVIVGTWAVMTYRGVQDPSNVLGVDFTSGSVVSFRFDEKRPVEEIRSALEKEGVRGAVIQYQREMDGSSESLVVKASADSAEVTRNTVTAVFDAQGFDVMEEVKVDAQVSDELRGRAIIAMGLALLGIIIYITWRFELGFAVGAIVALIHDVVLTVGVFSLFGRQLSLPVIAALLTIVGYSVNDTIVVFDRIREDLRVVRNRSFKDICNLSINQTLSRTLLTSLTTLLAVATLLVIGGGAVNDFALALFIGVLVGTYSSIFVATPVVLLWHRDRLPEFATAPK